MAPLLKMAHLTFDELHVNFFGFKAMAAKL